MISEIVGYCTVKNSLSTSEYFGGPTAEVTGKKLRVLERNRFGDCLCLTDKGLFDCQSIDVEKFEQTRRLF